MYILDRTWADEYLDCHCGRGQSLIRVSCWNILDPIDNAYIKRDPSLYILYNYVKEIGPHEKAGLAVGTSSSTLAEGLRAMLNDSQKRLSVTNRRDDVLKALSWEEPLAQMEALYSKFQVRYGTLNQKLGTRNLEPGSRNLELGKAHVHSWHKRISWRRVGVPY